MEDTDEGQKNSMKIEQQSGIIGAKTYKGGCLTLK